MNSLLGRDLGLGMVPAPGLAVGYCSGEHAAATATAWREALPELPTGTAEWVTDLLGWLDHFEEWTQAAAGQGRQPPDLVAVMAA